MKISKATLESVAWDSDIDMDNGIYYGYSGRGMYGKKTWGIVGTIEDYTKFMVQLTQSDQMGAELAWEMAQRVCTDSMGYDTIYYFPGIEVTDDDSA